MKKLAQLQNIFIDCLYDVSNDAALMAIKNDKIPAIELLEVYRNNLYSNLRNVLRLTYPQLAKLHPEKTFTKFCNEYIAQNRSFSGNLDDYGKNFSEFLAQKNELFSADLAKLEWLKQSAYLAADATAIDITSLQKIAAADLFKIKFQLHPSCFLLTSNFNLLSKNKRLQPSQKQNFFLIYRQNLTVTAEKISQREFNFLSGVKQNLSLFAIHQKHRPNIQNCLQKYLANGVLSSFSLT